MNETKGITVSESVGERKGNINTREGQQEHGEGEDKNVKGRKKRTSR